MKKIFFTLFSFLVLSGFTFAQSPLTPEYITVDCDKTANEKTNTPKCDKCLTDDDEYCVYNQCYMDKHFRWLKKKLCLNNQQECNIDSIYQKFKSDMEILCSRYRVQKNRVLEMIENSDKMYKEEAIELKELRKQMKNRIKRFINDIKYQLCQNQYKAFNKFSRQEKRRLKRIKKYGAVYKLPCNKNCN